MLKLRIPFLFCISLVLASACKQSEKLNNCANVRCATPLIDLRLKFEDKQTGTDLLFGSNSKYRLKDIEIYSTRLKKDIDFKVDSSGIKQTSIALSITASDELNISLGKLKTAVLKLETKFTKTDCCGTLELTGLEVNNSVNSFTNNGPTLITLKI
ncbi:hypothetical protein I5M32_07155 [Pedobacter sp. SD-b]|uniref:Lipoprotein n=1 Tax=Pedobacter segetis TaxID=2793069 RepID=A0ABS1BIR7_9SPHI|nr:hypothetical protein [Pedobacter segetis]MBK0382733.1 hypothetical protein [Pedobacter segetis]